MNPFRLTSRRSLSLSPSKSSRRRPGMSGGGQAQARAPGFTVPPWDRADDAPSPAACAVPWRLARDHRSGIIEVENTGDEPLLSVRFALAGAGLLGLSLPSTVAPGERLRVVLRGTLATDAAAGADAMLVLRWFRADGVELLWPISL
jgi:hypothetical protein